MSNANDFWFELGRARREYEDRLANGVQQLRVRGGGAAEVQTDKALLEAHLRAFFVDRLLRCLNWRMDQPVDGEPPNLVPEAPVLHADGPRYLDYFGIEWMDAKPLLIVETKRPNSPLPQLARPGRRRAPGTDPGPGEVAATLSRGLAGEVLAGEWQEWLAKLREYVEAVSARWQATPRRLVITDGEWLIAFLDPADAFLPEGQRSPEKIVCFLNWDDLSQRHTDLFRWLAHQHVLGEVGAVAPAEVPFHLRPDDVDRGLHGLRVLHFAQPRHYGERAPSIRVAPIFFLRSRYEAWLRVETFERGHDYEVPHTTEALPHHLRTVAEAGRRLRADIERVLGQLVEPISLKTHYSDELGFGALPGVRDYGDGVFQVLTGDQTHYLQREATVPGCPWHDWGRCSTDGSAGVTPPVLFRSVQPRSFFTSGEEHHCAHKDVIVPKRVPVTQANRPLLRMRSAKDGQAFCEIFSFEERLCCRTCVFEEACTSAEVFNRVLPCRRPDIPGAGPQVVELQPPVARGQRHERA